MNKQLIEESGEYEFITIDPPRNYYIKKIADYSGKCPHERGIQIGPD